MENTYLENHPFLIEDQNDGYLYYLKCTSNISNTRSANVTQYPTVSGKSISDNMYVQPKSCNFTISLGSIINGGQKYVIPEQQGFNDITAEELKQKFIEWQYKCIRLNITTFEDSFQNMVLQTINVSEDGQNGIGVWQASLSFVEVRVAEISEIKLDFPKTEEESANDNSESSLGADNGSVAGEVGSFIGNVGLGAAAGAIIGGPVGAVVGGAIGFFSWLFT